MNNFVLSELAAPVKRLILLFLLILSIGFFTGIRFVHFTTDARPIGIVTNYVGNEEDEEAEEMKFKKSPDEMLNLLHTHFLSLSVIFLILGILVYGCNISDFWKSFLMLEPMLSVLFTFGGIYGIWLGYEWLVYIVMLSGTLMTLSFVFSVMFTVKALFFTPGRLY